MTLQQGKSLLAQKKKIATALSNIAIYCSTAITSEGFHEESCQEDKLVFFKKGKD